MHGERGLLWVAGEVTIVSDAPSLTRLAPLLGSYGLATRCLRFGDMLGDKEPVSGLVVVDARAGIKRALSVLRSLPPALSRDAIVIADPAEPFVYRSLSSVCRGVVLYAPIDPTELAQVIDTVLSRRKAS